MLTGSFDSPAHARSSIISIEHLFMHMESEMIVTTDFKRDYAAALRNMHLNESEVARHTDKLASTEGLAPDLLAEAHFDQIIDERNTRVEAKVRATVRRMVCGACMVVPLTTVLAGAAVYLAV